MVVSAASPQIATISLHPLLEYLYGLENRGIKLGLEPTRQLLKQCGNPHREFPIVQIAGTNGKGSTAAMTARIMQSHGRKVGLYTSPHLCRFNERIRVDGFPISDHYIVQWLGRYRSAIEEVSATFFEATTVMALSFFRDQRVTIAILETGLGGRLDATTATDPNWTALAPIDLDHTDLLGFDVCSIAREKAGILKSGVPCFSAPQSAPVRAVIQAEAERIGTSVIFLDADSVVPVPLRLPGRHQLANARLAWALARSILGSEFNQHLAAEALETTNWPGRYQRLCDYPRIIYDVAHNPHGIAAFLVTMDEENVQGKKWLVLAIQRGKLAEQMLDMMLPRFDGAIFTQTGIHNFLPATELTALARTHAMPIQVKPDPVAAIRSAAGKAAKDDLVAILGSHYLGPAVASVFKISFDIL